MSKDKYKKLQKELIGLCRTDQMEDWELEIVYGLIGEIIDLKIENEAIENMIEEGSLDVSQKQADKRIELNNQKVKLKTKQLVLVGNAQKIFSLDEDKAGLIAENLLGEEN